MDHNLEKFIDEAIALELNAAEIYTIFSVTIPVDSGFWSGLSWEERNHAALLKTAKDVFMPSNKFPEEILPDFVQSLSETNNWLKTLLDKFAEEPPDRQSAFDIALKIENSAVEMPIVDGLKFFSGAKVFSPELHKKFVFFTGAPTPERLSFFENEDITYLVKPSTIAEIRETALQVLNLL